MHLFNWRPLRAACWKDMSQHVAAFFQRAAGCPLPPSPPTVAPIAAHPPRSLPRLANRRVVPPSYAPCRARRRVRRMVWRNTLKPSSCMLRGLAGPPMCWARTHVGTLLNACHHWRIVQLANFFNFFIRVVAELWSKLLMSKLFYCGTNTKIRDKS